MSVSELRPPQHLFGALLRHWRKNRGFTQLNLALEAEVSSRHVSFLENGRAMPGRDMILRLAQTLDVPPAEQNAMLRAAGFSPAFPEPEPERLIPHAIQSAVARMKIQQ